MGQLNLDRDAVIEPNGFCAYSAATAAPIANTINRAGSRARGSPLLLIRQELPPIPPLFSCKPAEIARLRSLPDALFIAWPLWGHGHWGHLLVEEAAVLWACLGESRITTVKTVILPAYARAGIERLQEQLAQHYELLFTSHLAAPLRVERLWSPVPSMHEGGPVDPSHFGHVITVLRSLDPNLQPPESPAWLKPVLPDRVYLSRSALPSAARKIADEPALEAALARRGWTILHPEQLPLQVQLQHLIQARHIAAPLGSALHSLMVLGHANSLTAAKQITVLTAASQLRFQESTLRAQLEAQAIPHRFLDCLQPCDTYPDPSQPQFRWQYGFSMPIERIVEALEQDSSQPRVAPMHSASLELRATGPAGCSRDPVELINANRGSLLDGALG